MRWMVLGFAAVLGLAGCAPRRSALLLERRARGPIGDEPLVAQALPRRLEPVTQTKTLEKIDVTVAHASNGYLRTFFDNKALFGDFAGSKANPFYPEHLVFHITIANHGEGKISIEPQAFTLVDDHGNQYTSVGVDYLAAFGDYRRPVTSATRGMLESASPGYFGFSLPVGKLLAGKPQRPFALLQKSSLQPGYIYPGVVYDGLVAFWNPVPEAKTLHLFVTPITRDFDANEIPRATVEFPFVFESIRSP